MEKRKENVECRIPNTLTKLTIKSSYGLYMCTHFRDFRIFFLFFIMIYQSTRNNDLSKRKFTIIISQIGVVRFAFYFSIELNAFLFFEIVFLSRSCHLMLSFPFCLPFQQCIFSMNAFHSMSLLLELIKINEYGSFTIFRIVCLFPYSVLVVQCNLRVFPFQDELPKLPFGWSQSKGWAMRIQVDVHSFGTFIEMKWFSLIFTFLVLFHGQKPVLLPEWNYINIQ